MPRTPLAESLQHVALDAHPARQAPAGADPDREGVDTTQDFQGYLNGAVFTGERAAGEVLDTL